MGLKELKSNLDLLGGFGQGGETLGEMENFSQLLIVFFRNLTLNFGLR